MSYEALSDISTRDLDAAKFLRGPVEIRVVRDHVTWGCSVLGRG